jgi:membrane protein required for beta-lactamase induction
MTSLKNVLFINAVSSAASALLLIVFPGFFAELFGTTHMAPFIVVGIFLLLFAVDVYLQSRKNPLNPKQVQRIIAMDISWVIGSLIIIVLRLFGLTFLGYLIIGGVALWVAAMAILQSVGLKQLSGN